MREVHAQLCALRGYLSLACVDEGCQHLKLRVGAQADGLAHGVHEFRAAVGIQVVVARVGGNHQPLRARAFRHARGNGQEDAVAERHHGLL